MATSERLNIRNRLIDHEGLNAADAETLSMMCMIPSEESDPDTSVSQILNCWLEWILDHEHDEAKDEKEVETVVAAPEPSGERQAKIAALAWMHAGFGKGNREEKKKKKTSAAAVDDKDGPGTSEK